MFCPQQQQHYHHPQCVEFMVQLENRVKNLESELYRLRQMIQVNSSMGNTNNAEYHNHDDPNRDRHNSDLGNSNLNAGNNSYNASYCNLGGNNGNNSNTNAGCFGAGSLNPFANNNASNNNNGWNNYNNKSNINYNNNKSGFNFHSGNRFDSNTNTTTATANPNSTTKNNNNSNSYNNHSNDNNANNCNTYTESQDIVYNNQVNSYMNGIVNNNNNNNTATNNYARITDNVSMQYQPLPDIDLAIGSDSNNSSSPLPSFAELDVNLDCTNPPDQNTPYFDNMDSPHLIRSPSIASSTSSGISNFALQNKEFSNRSNQHCNTALFNSECTDTAQDGRICDKCYNYYETPQLLVHQPKLVAILLARKHHVGSNKNLQIQQAHNKCLSYTYIPVLTYTISKKAINTDTTQQLIVLEFAGELLPAERTNIVTSFSQHYGVAQEVSLVKLRLFADFESAGEHRKIFGQIKLPTEVLVTTQLCTLAGLEKGKLNQLITRARNCLVTPKLKKALDTEGHVFEKVANSQVFRVDANWMDLLWVVFKLQRSQIRLSKALQ